MLSASTAHSIWSDHNPSACSVGQRLTLAHRLCSCPLGLLHSPFLRRLRHRRDRFPERLLSESSKQAISRQASVSKQLRSSVCPSVEIAPVISAVRFGMSPAGPRAAVSRRTVITLSRHQQGPRRSGGWQGRQGRLIAGASARLFRLYHP